MQATASSSRSGGRPGLLIDGNNVFGSRPDGWWRDRSAAARRLLTELGAHSSPELLTVVFDGPRQEAVADEAARQGIEVRFAPGGRDAADDEIVTLVASAADPRDQLVVTSDRRLRERVASLGATVVAPRSFLAELGGTQSGRAEEAGETGRLLPVLSVELSLPPERPRRGRDGGGWAGDLSALSQLDVDGIWVRGPASGHLAVLGALAAATDRPRLGPVVTVPGPPAPAVLAKNVTTLDVLSDGRAQLAFQPAPGGDARATTVGQGQRESRRGSERESTWQCLWESVAVCRLLFRNERADFAGRHVAIGDAVNLPSPVTGGGPPVLVAWAPGDEEAIGRGAARTLRSLRAPGRAAGAPGEEAAAGLLPDGVLVDDLAAVPDVRAAMQRLAAAVGAEDAPPAVLWRRPASDVGLEAPLGRARASGVAAVVYRIAPDDDLATLGRALPAVREALVG